MPVTTSVRDRPTWGTTRRTTNDMVPCPAAELPEAEEDHEDDNDIAHIIDARPVTH
jgi:hypothetical protein